LCALYPDLLLRNELGRDAVHVGTFCACGDGYLAGMKGHVPALNAFGGQCSNRRQVLGQANGGHDLA
jgi:hypothetical protein